MGNTVVGNTDPGKKTKRQINKETREVSRSGRRKANTELSKDAGKRKTLDDGYATPGESRRSAKLMARANAAYQAERSGKSRKETRKAKRAAGKAAMKDDSNKVSSIRKSRAKSREAVWDSNKKAKAAYKGDQSESNRLKLKESARQKKHTTNSSAKAARRLTF